MRRALCVGVDQYSFGSLRGCVADAERMAALLSKHEDGSANFDCLTLIAPDGGGDDIVTRGALKKAMDQLLKDKAEVAIFHFSGHGTQNNLGGFLVTQDAQAYDEGVPMTDLLTLANASKVDEVVIILDCCQAGNLGNAPAIDNTKAVLREGVSILTASRGDQVSVEANGAGLFTSLVADGLEGGAADVLGNVTAPAIYAFVEAALGAWQQRPLFKAHVSTLVSLRRCDPPIETSTLRELPALFPVPAEDLHLGPEYERSLGTGDPAKQEVFRKLQALNRVHLVVPVGTDHMYDAAAESKACRLTAAGRYYWRLARDSRI